jgi:hypothetical protein
LANPKNTTTIEEIAVDDASFGARNHKITGEARALLVNYGLLELAPLIATFERVDEINVEVLAYLFHGRLANDPGRAAAYCECLKELDETLTDEDMMDEASTHTHNMIQLSRAAAKALSLEGNFNYTSGPVDTGTAIASALTSFLDNRRSEDMTEVPIQFEQERRASFRDTYGFTLCESKIPNRAGLNKLKEGVVNQTSWPSEENLPYRSIKDSVGGGALQTKTLEVRGNDLTVADKATNEVVISNSWHAVRQYSLKVYGAVLVGHKVAVPVGYDARGTGKVPGDPKSYLIGWNEVNAFVEVLERGAKGGIPKDGMHTILMNADEEIRAFTREPTFYTPGAAISSVTTSVRQQVTGYVAGLAGNLSNAGSGKDKNGNKVAGGGGKGPGGPGKVGKWGKLRAWTWPHPYAAYGKGGKGDWQWGDSYSQWADHSGWTYGGKGGKGVKGGKGSKGSVTGKGKGGKGGKGDGGVGGGGGGAAASMERYEGGNPAAPACADFWNGGCHRATCGFSHVA